MSTTILTRSQAGLRPARSTPARIDSEGVTVHYTGPTPWGKGPDRSTEATFARTASHDRCVTLWQGIQAYHLDTQGWNDVAYSAMACPHGLGAWGRGPGRRTAANGTNEGNRRSEAILYLAGQGDPLTDAARVAILDIAAELDGGRVRWDHSDWKATACAGDPVRAWEAKGWRRPGGQVAQPVAPVRPLLPIHPGDKGGHVSMWQAALNHLTAVVPLGNRQPIRVTGVHDAASIHRTLEFERWSNGMDTLARNGQPPLQVDGLPTVPTVDRLARWRRMLGV